MRSQNAVTSLERSQIKSRKSDFEALTSMIMSRTSEEIKNKAIQLLTVRTTRDHVKVDS